jgi:hypothetical protein
MTKSTVLTVILLLSGCAQMTTRVDGSADLASAAELKGDAYKLCLRQTAKRLFGMSQEAGFVVDSARSSCSVQLNDYKKAQTEYLETKYMQTGDELEKSVAALEEKSRLDVVAMLVAAEGTASIPHQTASVSAAVPSAALPSAALPSVAAGVTAPPVATVATTASAAATVASTRPVTGAFTPDFEQRIYIDCMEDQARKYVRLNETAAAIAEVAANRCKSHLTGNNQNALEREGRAVVMGDVFDARLEASP